MFVTVQIIRVFFLKQPPQLPLKWHLLLKISKEENKMLINIDAFGFIIDASWMSFLKR